MLLEKVFIKIWIFQYEEGEAEGEEYEEDESTTPAPTTTTTTTTVAPRRIPARLMQNRNKMLPPWMRRTAPKVGLRMLRVALIGYLCKRNN